MVSGIRERAGSASPPYILVVCWRDLHGAPSILAATHKKGLIVYQFWENFSNYFSKYLLPSHPFKDASYIWLFEVAPWFTDALFIFFPIFFSLYISFWRVSTAMVYGLLIFSFPLSNLLLIPYSVFFISDIVVSICRGSIVSF